MRENKEKISVVVSIYNTEKYLDKCIKSIINQTYSNLEIILIDNGSTDHSKHICDKYKNIDDRIITIHCQNQDLSTALNTALDIASGHYITFVDSYDWIEFDMFELLYKNMIDFEADISTCDFKIVSEFEKNIFDKVHNGIVTTILEGYNKIENIISETSKFKSCIWNKLYKKFLFKNIRFREGKIYQDIIVVCKLADKAKKIVKSSEYKYHYTERNIEFQINQLDIVEAYIEQHDYISIRYPVLEQDCRKNILLALIDSMYKVYKENSIVAHKKKLLQIINSAKKYDINYCGLNTEQINMVKLLFTDIKNYIIGVKLSYNYQNNNKDTNKTDKIKKKEKAVLEYYEYHISEHCNLNCKGCTHFCNIVEEPHFADYEQYCRDLKALKGLYKNISRIRLMGGEPLLNPKLPEFIKVTRETFPESKLVVVTNGLLLPKAEEHLFKIMRDCECILNISVYKPTYTILSDLQDILKKNNIYWQCTTPFIPVESFNKNITLLPFNNAAIPHNACTKKQCH
jgi:glycosyltransferase involved in cell wall biosynthesis